MSVTPKLSLDFTSAVLNPLVAFTRAAATATRFNSSGYVEVVAADTPRFDFNSVTLACRGLLVEETRQNLLTYSNTFTDASWTKLNVTLSASGETSPDGATTATKAAISAATANIQTYKTATVVAGTSYTMSTFAKKGELSLVNLGLLYNANEYAGTQFNLDTGAVVRTAALGAGYTATNPVIRPLKNGWYWVSVTVTTGRTTAFPCLMPSNVTWASGRLDQSLTGNGTDGIHIWGSQFEVGAFATSYIPTTTAAVTRNADVATITSTAFSGFWRSGPGSILVRALPSTVSGTRPLVQVDDATADNIIALRGNTTNPELYIREGGADKATIDAGTISAAAYRLAGAWQAGSAAASLNNGLAVNGAPASIPAVTQMRLGSDGTNYLNGHLQAVQYWDSKLSNTTLRMASSTAGRRSLLKPIITPII